MKKQTKIVATVGPACANKETLVKMIQSGMNSARLNFSHGTHENHAELIKTIRVAAEATGEPIMILQDLQGPKMRLGTMPAEGLILQKGEKIILNTAISDYLNQEIPITYPGLEKFLKVGERILVDDGHITLLIKSIESSKIFTEVIEGNIASSHKGLNFPDSTLVGIPALSEKDKDDVRFGVEMGVDAIALSFVKKPEDIKELKQCIEDFSKELRKNSPAPIMVIAKIERPEAVENIDTILAEVGGIMVARGDLGLEIRAGEVPLVQKAIIKKANKLAKPVIVATQMLDSMQKNSRPTRAEVSDVVNAVIDHADALMLSNETAAGSYPVETIVAMADAIVCAEESPLDNVVPEFNFGVEEAVNSSIARVAAVLGEEIHAKAILASSTSGTTGRLVSSFRPEMPMYVATMNDRVCRQLNLSWGVRPFVISAETVEERNNRMFAYLKENNVVNPQEKVILVAGGKLGEAGNIDEVKVVSV